MSGFRTYFQVMHNNSKYKVMNHTGHINNAGCAGYKCHEGIKVMQGKQLVQVMLGVQVVQVVQFIQVMHVLHVLQVMNVI